MTIPACPKCRSSYVYEDAPFYICPECSYEWEINADVADSLSVKDCYGAVLEDGDTVIVMKDLKVKGASSPIKKGTKVKNIRLVDSDHNIDCKIPGIGAMGLKSEFVKKA